MTGSTIALTQRLAGIPAFVDLSPGDLGWLASQLEVAQFAPGEIVIPEDSPADRMIVILEGEVASRREQGGDARTYSAGTGSVTGMLPFSRLTHFPLTSRAMRPTTVAFLHASHFPEMLERCPALGQRLVGVMSDRIRETTTQDQQREKLMALGKLSAGLAHELNNPASAVRNAAVALQSAVRSLRTAGLHLDKRPLEQEDRVFLARIECDWSRNHPPAALDSLERSDREEAVGDWLEARGVADARHLAPALVDAGCDLDDLRGISARFNDQVLADVVTRLAASFAINRLIEQIESGTSRMADLVRAVKQYTYMDQSSEQEVDIHQGIENTLIMLHHRLKYGICVKREFDRTVPPVCAHGSELNQVWTNLIDNAIDAMNGRGELVVRTAGEFGKVLVEIRDNGPGIPAAIRSHIFEPFFTTKPVGEGTGLGLDTVYRIVQKHKGEIRVDSEAGRTSFLVRLPFAHSGGSPAA